MPPLAMQVHWYVALSQECIPFVIWAWGFWQFIFRQKTLILEGRNNGIQAYYPEIQRLMYFLKVRTECVPRVQGSIFKD